ncbi:MAG: hypothetical protein R3F61_06985 [Myxococcota bacterium]
MRIGVGFGVVVALVGSVACSWCECQPGIWPFDGATGVSPEGPFEVVSNGVWDPEVVALAGVVRLTNADGEWVDASVELVDPSTLEVKPVGSLPAGTYQLDVVHASALDEGTSGHYVDPGFGPSGGATVHFTVGGDPRVIGWFRDSTAEGVDVLAFSDAIDATTLDGRVSIGGEPVDLSPLGSDGRLFSFALPVDAEVDPSLDPELHLDDGVRTRSGLLVPETDLTRGSDVLERLTGEPWCAC